MITTISILLYFIAAFFAAMTGVLAERRDLPAGRFGLGMFAVAFVMAVSLQVYE